MLPTTSQVTPAAFQKVFQEVADAGDTAVVVTISGKLSGTYQSAMIAREGYEEKIFIVDSENVCVGERALAMRGLALIQEGMSAEETAAVLDREKHQIRLIALLDTLEYLQKGGRISKTVAIAGSLLSIKPVIALENGEVSLIGKARGFKKGNTLLREMIEKTNGIDFKRPCYFAYSGLSDEAMKKFVGDNEDLWKEGDKVPAVTTIGTVIGTHAGPGAIAIAFFEK